MHRPSQVYLCDFHGSQEHDIVAGNPKLTGLLRKKQCTAVFVQLQSLQDPKPKAKTLKLFYVTPDSKLRGVEPWNASMSWVEGLRSV